MSNNKPFDPELISIDPLKDFETTKGNIDIGQETGEKKEPDCVQHKKSVAGISDMKKLAEIIGDLHYESLSNLLYYLSDKLYNDGRKDSLAGRHLLCNELYSAQLDIHKASQHIDQAWKISKPFMQTGSTGKQEDQRTFSLKDMLNCWEAAFYDGGSVYHGHANSPNRVDKGKYFSDKFNIDITKQQ